MPRVLLKRWCVLWHGDCVVFHEAARAVPGTQASPLLGLPLCVYVCVCVCVHACVCMCMYDVCVWPGVAAAPAGRASDVEEGDVVEAVRGHVELLLSLRAPA